MVTPMPSIDIDQAKARNTAILRSYLDLFESLKFEEWGELWSEQGKFIIPYPVNQPPTIIAGKETLVEHFNTFKPIVAEMRFSDIDIIQATNSELFVVKMSNYVKATNGYEYKNKLVWFVKIEDDKISEILEYFDPVAYNQFVKELSA
ncbi:nuclear transport factor 2 family protein [Gloeocapsa sp. BRSZ]